MEGTGQQRKLRKRMKSAEGREGGRGRHEETQQQRQGLVTGRISSLPYSEGKARVQKASAVHLPWVWGQQALAVPYLCDLEKSNTATHNRSSLWNIYLTRSGPT